MTDESPDRQGRDQHVRALAARLESTARLPIDHRTNRWLGEAEAIAQDTAASDLDAPTVRKRVRQVRDLLDEAGDTDHGEADSHLREARELCDVILSGPVGDEEP